MRVLAFSFRDDLGAEVLLPDLGLEHSDGRRAILEIVGFWTPEYLDEKLDCTSEDIDLAADRVLWFKTGIHVYDVVDLAEEYAL